MSAVWYTFHLEAGGTFIRTIDSTVPGLVLPAAATEARMTVRNSLNIVVATYDSAGTAPAITINAGAPPTYTITLDTPQTLQYGVGFPGVVQSVSYWGIGRAYLYDFFVNDGSTQQWTKLLYGTIQVTPGVTTDLDAFNDYILDGGGPGTIYGPTLVDGGTP